MFGYYYIRNGRFDHIFFGVVGVLYIRMYVMCMGNIMLLRLIVKFGCTEK